MGNVVWDFLWVLISNLVKGVGTNIECVLVGLDPNSTVFSILPLKFEGEKLDIVESSLASLIDKLSDEYPQVRCVFLFMLTSVMYNSEGSF